MRPVAGPRGFTGPISVKKGSCSPGGLVGSQSARSFVPGFSLAMACLTASSTSAASMPTSSGFLCCQSNRSGKYDVPDSVDALECWATSPAGCAARAGPAVITTATHTRRATRRAARQRMFLLTGRLALGRFSSPLPWPVCYSLPCQEAGHGIPCVHRSLMFGLHDVGLLRHGERLRAVCTQTVRKSNEASLKLGHGSLRRLARGECFGDRSRRHRRLQLCQRCRVDGSRRGGSIASWLVERQIPLESRSAGITPGEKSGKIEDLLHGRQHRSVVINLVVDHASRDVRRNEYSGNTHSQTVEVEGRRTR